MDDQLLNEKAKFEMAWEALTQLEINEVTVEFEGSGDEGHIHNIEPNCYVDEFNKFTVTLDTETITLSDLIENLSSGVIDQTGIDWYNNEGGFGRLTWHVDLEDPGDEAPTHYLDLEISERIVSTNDYTFEYDRHGGKN